MPTRKKSSTIFFAVLGCLFIILFFVSNKLSKTTRHFQQIVSTNDIIKAANARFEKTEFADYNLRPETKIELNRELFVFQQTRLGYELPPAFYPVASCRIDWRGKIESRKEGEQDVLYVLEYDYQNRLIYFEQDSPELRRSHSLKEQDALKLATKFLAEQNVDTAKVTFSYKIINKDDRLLQYGFTFNKPSPVSAELVETYDVNISGANVVRYEARVIYDSNDSFLPAYYDKAQTVSHVLAFVVWCLLGVVILIQFFKKIRNDELEFKRGLLLGIFMFVLAFAAVALTNRGNWVDAFYAGGLGGLASCLGMMLVYAVSDSYARDVWPKKYALMDVIWRGFFRIKEFGQSILDSLFLSGLSLLLITLFFVLTSSFGIGHLEFSDKSLQIFYGKNLFIANAIDTLVSACFIGLLLFSFWASYLKKYIKNDNVLLVTFALFINLAGLHLVGIQPTSLSFVLLLPLALIWSYATLKLDLFTIILALFWALLGKDLYFLPHIESAFFSLPGLTFSIILILAFIFGSYFLFSEHSTAHFSHYIPSYVNRIAERERFLKELEIARRLQMRFLPQSVPDCPNLDIACVCKPAMEVGGDYYDFVQNGNDSLAVIIGDVSGKGVSAAFYMTMAKGIIKTLTKSIVEPKRILSEMNTIFYENVPKDVFISVIYGEFNLKKNVLRFARAGHNPLIVCKGSDGRIESILPRGLAIGLDRGVIFSKTIEEIEIPFEKNDVFVFFTDGISESTNGRGDEFSEQRLQEVVKLHANKTAEKLVDAINLEIVRFADDKNQHDDLTMVVVKIGKHIV